jgi:uncharacterized membrane protein
LERDGPALDLDIACDGSSPTVAIAWLAGRDVPHNNLLMETLQMRVKQAFVTMSAAISLGLAGLVLSDEAPKEVIEEAEAEAAAAADINEAVSAAAEDAQAEADAAVAVAKENKDSYAAQKAAEAAASDAAFLKEAEAVTSELKKETETEAMLKKQSGMISGEN